MPITFRIDHDRRLVVARGYGTFAESDAFNYQQEAWSDEAVAGYDELVDMTHVIDVVTPSPARVQHLASIAARKDRPSIRSRFAIVAPTDLLYGLGRMLQTYRELEKDSTKEVGVFRTMKEALDFLRLEEEPPFPEIPIDNESTPP